VTDEEEGAESLGGYNQRSAKRAADHATTEPRDRAGGAVIWRNVAAKDGVLAQRGLLWNLLQFAF
jgi:hypothetical protein